jgi:hypothetical protein
VPIVGRAVVTMVALRVMRKKDSAAVIRAGVDPVVIFASV